MKLTGENHINASPQEVWNALNDPAILKQAIPGCDTLEKLSDTAFKATVTTKIGPVQARFAGEVELSDLDPPNGYTISGKGSGGVAGNARGSAKVKLTPEGNGTRLAYDVDAQVTGKLAQLGSRLIDSTAKMLAGQFFNKFEQLVSRPAELAAPAADAASAAVAAQPTSPASAIAASASTEATSATLAAAQRITGTPAVSSKPVPFGVWALVIAAFVLLFIYYFR